MSFLIAGTLKKIGKTVIAAQMISAASMAAEPPTLRIVGGASSMDTILSLRQDLETAAKIKLDLKPGNSENAITALEKGLIEGASSAIDMNSLFDGLKKSGKANPDITKYESVQIGNGRIFVALNPSNPATSLNHDQVAQLVSGKLKTWEPINKRADPVVVIWNNDLVAFSKGIPMHYIGQPTFPAAEYVTNKDGQLSVLQRHPGGLTFFPETKSLNEMKIKKFETDYTYPLFLIAKKPLTPEMKRLFETFKARTSKDSKGGK